MSRESSEIMLSCLFKWLLTILPTQVNDFQNKLRHGVFHLCCTLMQKINNVNQHLHSPSSGWMWQHNRWSDEVWHFSLRAKSLSRGIGNVIMFYYSESEVMAGSAIYLFFFVCAHSSFRILHVRALHNFSATQIHKISTTRLNTENSGTMNNKNHFYRKVRLSKSSDFAVRKR